MKNSTTRASKLSFILSILLAYFLSIQNKTQNEQINQNESNYEMLHYSSLLLLLLPSGGGTSTDTDDGDAAAVDSLPPVAAAA